MIGMGKSQALRMVRLEVTGPEGREKLARIKARLEGASHRSGEPAPPAWHMKFNGMEGQEVHTWQIYSPAVLDHFEALGGES